MTSWTLDPTTLQYWSTSDTGQIIWGTPKYGDEIIINENLKYIFMDPKERPKDTVEDDLIKLYSEMAKKFK